MLYDGSNMIAMGPTTATSPFNNDIGKRSKSLRQSLRRQELNNSQSITMKPITTRRQTFVDYIPEVLDTNPMDTAKVRASLRTSMRPTTVPTTLQSSRRVGATARNNVENNESVVSDVSFV
jgi:hypothetical protein